MRRENNEQRAGLLVKKRKGKWKRNYLKRQRLRLPTRHRKVQILK